MEEIVKDYAKDLYALIDSWLTPNDISVCFAQADLASMLLRKMYDESLTYAELAALLGISKRKLSKLIAGDVDIPLSLINKICDVCGMQFKIEFEKDGK